MLSELFIRNFAIIDELRLRFHAGFNVLTGETGAGKSIILDAVALVLGDRADTAMIRAGCAEAHVEATFALNGAVREETLRILKQEELEGDEDDLIVLARELRSNGRSISRINGRTVGLALLRQVADPLIDIHGQGEHLSLLKPQAHLPILDAFAGLVSEREEVGRQVAELQRLQRELARLRRDERELGQRIDMLEFQIKEIDAAHLKPGEEEELREERDRLANAEHLTEYASEAVRRMIGLEDDGNESISDALGQVERALAQLARYDQSQSGQLESLQGLEFQVAELGAELQKYLSQLEFNPERLNQVEERLELIGILKRKYGADIPAVLAWQQKAIAELAQISSSQERVAELESQQDGLLRQIGSSAHALSNKRKAAAQELSATVVSQLQELNMDGSRFSVDFTFEPSSGGVYVVTAEGEQRLAFDRSGIDRAEFLITTNPGEPLKPMAKVASGGETSRLMLALKTALTSGDETPTLIFDEIDQGIGGRVGDVAGRKLWGLAALSGHQVIVVTHLPQLAVYGDCHFHVSKETREGRTITAVASLDEPGRVGELAAMLGNLGEHGTAGAESILHRAAEIKRSALVKL